MKFLAFLSLIALINATPCDTNENPDCVEELTTDNGCDLADAGCVEELTVTEEVVDEED